MNRILHAFTAVLCFAAVFFTARLCAAADSGVYSYEEIKNVFTPSVIYLIAAENTPSPRLPHIPLQGRSSQGTGFVVKVPTLEEPAGELMIFTGIHFELNSAHTVYAKRPDEQKYYESSVYKKGVMPHGNDFSLLRVKDKDFFKGLSPIKFSPSAPAAREAVYTIGYPETSKTPIFRDGIFKAYSKDGPFYVVSFSVKQGLSGAPLLNSRGEAVGIIHAVLNKEPGSLAIPSTVINRFLAQIYAEEIPVSGSLCQDSLFKCTKSPKCLGREGALAVVSEGGFFDRAGIKMFDHILYIGGHRVTSAGTLINKNNGYEMPMHTFLQETKPGDKVSVTYSDYGKSKEKKTHAELCGVESSDAAKRYYNGQQRYFVTMGIVFTERNNRMTDDSFTTSIYITGIHSRAMLSPDAYSERLIDRMVKSINGTEVDDIESLVEALQKDPYNPVMILYGQEDKPIYFKDRSKAKDDSLNMIIKAGLNDESSYIKKTYSPKHN
ncbi:serine protease [Parelusimicrobium proximum]|uniref:trypsin-like peptidase domain-containing protein n=1 Tax=Parelusimicrobium proximum TaxID=3228953 RepID=UPI003D1650E9